MPFSVDIIVYQVDQARDETCLLYAHNRRDGEDNRGIEIHYGPKS